MENEKDMNEIVNVIKIPQNRFVSMKPSEIWAEVRQIAKLRYRY